MRRALHARARAVKKFLSAGLRFASANNWGATGVTTFNLATGCAQTDILQDCSHIIAQDVTSITLGMMAQWIKNSTGISNVGNGITFAEMAVVYNGVAVAVTTSSATTWTVSDTANWFSDPLASTSFGGAVKFSKGTWLQVRFRVRTSSPTTDKFPTGFVGRPAVDTVVYLDPAKQTITNGVMATSGIFVYTNKTWAITSATASGTVVTVTMPDTSVLPATTPNKFTIVGATGSGSALQYNQNNVVVTIVNSTTATYDVATVGGTAPAATATGSLSFSGKNGTDANNGSGTIPIHVLANHNGPSVVFFGDSKTHGTNDTVPATGLVGMSRTLVSDATNPTTVVCAGINMGCPSGISMEMFTATASGVVANNEYWYTLCNHAVVGYGTNGTSTSDQASLWARIRAKGITPIVQRSLTPRSTSTVTATLSGNGTTVTATMASSFITNLGLTVGQTFTGAITGATPSGYNTPVSAGVPTGATMTVASATTVTYANVTTGAATGTILISDMWQTTGNQVPHALWASGQLADTFESYCRTAVSSDANLTFYQSTAERAGTSGANYWLWKANGTANYATWDGLHESATGYELNVRTAGTVTTQGGGTVAGSLASLVAAFT